MVVSPNPTPNPNPTPSLDQVRLLELVEALLANAGELLARLPTRHAAAHEAQQALVGGTYMGTLLPWLVDDVVLFSLFGHEMAYRLLPALLPVLDQLQRLLSSHARRVA